ncbi:TetR/AcrR family transcriptional regulator [Streptomyces sp. YIM 132580]|uniref:TetR/AcrR family transcriptional regulator n=1 Tax=Streptomyces sp. YIM 132580 TaxID=2691958 RepID=UPI001370AEDE|nr:TetR/AcrR family transcriptional regulator [Streptomyces sp. YIM 132580]MXG30316.1 TetR family transcriptional regulator [Streptomyces sp. YIM 132580]
MAGRSIEADARDEGGTTVTSGREEEILDAALRVFLRFGYRRSSMDEVARGANLSRQGLYLHFSSKQALFHATIERMIGQVRTATLTALEREDADLTQRLADAMAALHGNAAGADRDVVGELLAAAADVSGPLLDRLHDNVVDRVADLLRDSGVEDAWRDAGLNAVDLAEHLYLITTAVAQSGGDLTRQYQALHTAARIATRGRSG